MTEAELEIFYEAGYRQLYQEQESPKPADLTVQEGRARHVLGFLQDQVPGASRILDIGCSAGVLLQRFQDRYQGSVCGVEPGRMYREYAQRYGLAVYPSLDELLKTKPTPFSLVSMMHVLEHLPYPMVYLRHLRQQLLEPEGWLLLEVPNLYAHDCFEVAHLVSFSPQTLTQLVQAAGYQVVKLKAHGMPRSRFMPLYITLLARPALSASESNHIQRESNVMLRRRLGLLRRRITERIIPHAWG